MYSSVSGLSAQIKVSGIHSCCSIHQQIVSFSFFFFFFLLLLSIVWIDHAWFIHSLKEGYIVVSRFRWLWIKFLWTSKCKLFCGCLFPFFYSKFPRVEVLDQGESGFFVCFFFFFAIPRHMDSWARDWLDQCCSCDLCRSCGNAGSFNPKFLKDIFTNKEL